MAGKTKAELVEQCNRMANTIRSFQEQLADQRGKTVIEENRYLKTHILNTEQEKQIGALQLTIQAVKTLSMNNTNFAKVAADMTKVLEAGKKAKSDKFLIQIDNKGAIYLDHKKSE